MDLGRVQRLSGLATQGYKYGSWVTEYRVNHSVDGVTWTTIKTNDSTKVCKINKKNEKKNLELFLSVDVSA